MNKTEQKRHERQGPQAKGRLQLPEPDVRTPEQTRPAPKACHPVRGSGEDPRLDCSMPSMRSDAVPSALSRAKAAG